MRIASTVSHIGPHGETIAKFWQEVYVPWAVASRLGRDHARYGISYEVGEAWVAILRDWLPTSGLQLDARPCFEYYPEGADCDSDTGPSGHDQFDMLASLGIRRSRFRGREAWRIEIPPLMRQHSSKPTDPGERHGNSSGSFAWR